MKFNMRAAWSRRLNWVATVSFVLLGGCSMVGLGYKQLDHLTFWWMNRYVGFDGEQADLAKQRLAQLHNWHRKEEIPEYIRWLEEMDKQFQGPIGTEQIQAISDGVRLRINRLARRAVPDLADIALTLTTEQIRKIARRMNDNNQDFREDYLLAPVDKVKANRAERLLDQADYWLGSLDKTQKQQITTWSNNRTLYYEMWFAERQLKQQAMLAMLERVEKNKPAPAVVRQWVQEVLGGFEYSSDAQRQAYFKAYELQTTKVVVDIWNNASEQQRAHAHKKLRGWIEDLKALRNTAEAGA